MELKAVNSASEKIVSEYGLRIDDLENEINLTREENSRVRQSLNELKAMSMKKDLELQISSEELEFEKEKNKQLDNIRVQAFEKQKQSECNRFKLEEQLALTQLELQATMFKV